jgi:3',5'-cyclic AMP phosphodiesterase CpdA
MAAAAQVAGGGFDLAVVNGDIARAQGQGQDYIAFNGLVSPALDEVPVAITLGNHDDRKNARGQLVHRAGEVRAVEQKLVTTVDAAPFRFVFLDSLTVTNIAAGQLGQPQRDWLAQYLDSGGTTPTLVFVHHNPDPSVALEDAEQLLALLKAHRAVKALFFGHTHVYSVTQVVGLHLVNLPAIGYNFADGNPVGWVSASLSAEGGELTLRAIAGEQKDSGKVTRLAWR